MTDERDGTTLPMEYVLGLMDGQERRAFELELLDDPELAAAVWQAESDLAPLQAALKPRTPPPRVKRGIERKLFPGQREKGRSKPPMALAFWRSLAGLFGLAAVGAAAVIAVLVVRPDVLLPQSPPYVAAILDDEGHVTLARMRQDGSLVTQPYTGALGEDRDPELWIIYDGADPLSLGVMSGDSRTLVPSDAFARDRLPGARLVVTDEPKGGSPTGDPTGPAVAQGPLQEI